MPAFSRKSDSAGPAVPPPIIRACIEDVTGLPPSLAQFQPVERQQTANERDYVERCSVSPFALASFVCMSMQKAQPLIWEARTLTSARNEASILLPAR